MQIGYKLASEGFGPNELIRQAVRAEEAGFDFVEMSDHFHPWLDAQGHSPFTWTVLGAIAARTERIGLATGVTCPTVRYHPAIIAQAAATLALVSQDRFTLGVGAGERLNEHIVGQGFPAVHDRHARLREALEIIRLLWSGGYHSYDGRHLRLEDARVFDLPERLPLIAVACSGPVSARIAAELGDGLFGWKVMSELPNPVNFDAASASVTADDIRRQFSVGPDPDVHVEAVRRYADAGFDRLVLQNAGPDPDGFIDFYAEHLADRLAGLRQAVVSPAG
jgi:alkanesulfonate monooxygenase SsuD/methylene tetrahydromethanopterin reductase-like flavin-dependent oxidoreductase (luciferase family)